MGTRSLIHFKDDDGKTIATVYRQFDGYPEGRGVEIAEFLQNMVLVDGYQADMEAPAFANGMGCLAAQWIAHEKQGIGNVYLYAPDSSDVWEEYVYTVERAGKNCVKAGTGEPIKSEKICLTCEHLHSGAKWIGPPSEFTGRIFIDEEVSHGT